MTNKLRLFYRFLYSVNLELVELVIYNFKKSCTLSVRYISVVVIGRYRYMYNQVKVNICVSMKQWNV